MATQFELQNAPGDLISCVKFSPLNHDQYSSFLLASSWDSTINLYDTKLDRGQLLTRIDGGSPLLDCCWDSQGRRAITGGLEGRVKWIDLETGNISTLGEHQDSVRNVVVHAESGAVVSGSWDRSIGIHDQRSGNSQKYNLPHKVFSMDIFGNMLVVGMAKRGVYIYDIRRMSEPYQRRESSLKYMTRSIKCIPTGDGFASASIEGRISVDYFDASANAQAKKYAFKCHRAIEQDMDVVYPVNALAFHRQYGTFVSGGGDSLVCFWDHKARKRLRQYPRFPGPIQALDIDSHGGSLAVSYGDDNYAGVGNQVQSGVIIRRLMPGEGKSKV
ncbi:WD40-repeat-containing domain protein [Lipomyces japonicus]|uniref:WD40-repeat-containing domain protein n=1 Tax=Lipomyces japonicus TaxID=56871 RepID=UPI0034CD0F31